MGIAAIYKSYVGNIMQIIKVRVGCQYGDPYLTFKTINQMYNEAHVMYNRKQKSPMEENPQKEVLQSHIQTGKAWTVLFY